MTAITPERHRTSAGLSRTTLRHRIFETSIRRRLFALLVLPMMLIVLVSSVFFYVIALAYTNKVHDHDLDGEARGMAHMLQSERSVGIVSRESQALIEYSPEGRNFFSVRSYHHGLISGSKPSIPPLTQRTATTAPELYDTFVGMIPVRAAAVIIASPVDPTDQLTVTIAETLQSREQRANEILFLMIPVELLLSALLLALVWFGVQYGLRILAPLTQRLARRDTDLTPITAADVPIEILPLTRTIDGLFARLRGLMDSQERFVADAAHQLRTPLAGLMLHAEHAANATRIEDRDDSLQHIRDLSMRTARTSSQLLAMARAQSIETDRSPMRMVQIDPLLRTLLATRVRHALDADLDLGYEGAKANIAVMADPIALQEAIENLIDNAMRHARQPHGKVTVSLAVADSGLIRLCVEDNGCGVPEIFRSQLGERFFRPPGAIAGGTGLGLAIVKRIVERHDGDVVFSDSALGGLRVEIFLTQAGAQ